MWEYVLGGATIFGLIVALGTWFNGRVTRKIMIQHFERLDKRFEEVLKRVDGRFEGLVRGMDRRFEEVLSRMDERFNELIKQHNKLIEQHNKILKTLSTQR